MINTWLSWNKKSPNKKALSTIILDREEERKALAEKKHTEEVETKLFQNIEITLILHLLLFIIKLKLIALIVYLRKL